VLRAPESNVVGMAHQIYMRSGGGGSNIKPGNITLDANRNASKSAVILQIQDGKFRFVETVAP
jgi:hypothetical protein